VTDTKQQFIQAVQSAQLYQKEKNFEKSLPIWNELVSADPDHLIARLGAANDSFALGLVDKAKVHFNTLAQNYPSHAAGFIGSAKIARQNGDLARAAQCWKSAWKILPERPNFAVMHLECLILTGDPVYHQSLKQFENEIDQFDRGCLVVANALATIKDTQTECEFLKRQCTDSNASEFRLQLIRRLIISMVLVGKTSDIADVLNKAKQVYGIRLAHYLVEDTFAKTLFPAEADWLLSEDAWANEQGSEYSDDSIAIRQILLARANLWNADSAIAANLFATAKEILSNDCTDDNHDAFTFALLAECCIEVGDSNAARSAIDRLAKIVIETYDSKSIKYFLPFIQTESVNGYETARKTAEILVKNYFSESGNLHNGYLLALLCVQTNLQEQVASLYHSLKPVPGHWLDIWWRRAEPGVAVKNTIQGKLSNGALPLFAKFKNEEKRIPRFLDYYRNMGVTHFFMIDNCSSDGATDYLQEQEDVSVWSANGTLNTNMHCVPWVNALIDKYSPSHWCVSVDVDEYLNFTDSESDRSLHQLTSMLDRNGEEIVSAFMLDMYPEQVSDIRAPEEGEELTQLHPWFDNNYRFLGAPGAPYTQAIGGFRSRIWPGMYHEPLSKTPVFNSRGGVRLINANHKTNGGVPSKTTGALRHYRFADDMDERATFSEYISKTIEQIS